MAGRLRPDSAGEITASDRLTRPEAAVAGAPWRAVLPTRRARSVGPDRDTAFPLLRSGSCFLPVSTCGNLHFSRSKTAKSAGNGLSAWIVDANAALNAPHALVGEQNGLSASNSGALLAVTVQFGESAALVARGAMRPSRALRLE